VDAVRFAEQFFHSWLERMFGRGGKSGEGELGGMEGAVQRGGIIGLRKRHLLEAELGGPEGRDGNGLGNAGGCQMGVGPNGGAIAV